MMHAGGAIAQQANDKKNLKIAEDAFERADYLRAKNLYEQISNHDTSNIDVVYKIGLCILAVDKTDTTCLSYFRRSKNRINEAHYYLGKVYHLEGKEKQALEEYYKFKSKNKGKEISLEEVETSIRTAESALEQEAKKESWVIHNAGAKVNSSYPDYVPLIWNLNGSLVFTSRREGSKGGLKDPYGHYYEDVFVSRRSEEKWQPAVPISDAINTEAHDACVAFSPDGNELLIYRTDEKQTGGDLYISTYNGSEWSIPVKLGPEINSEFLETSACFSSSGNEIIFASNRPGGFGGKDLYITRKFMNGRYSLPRNMGPEINSSEEEDAPFIDKYSNDLYFSSKGHNSIGEYDIFISKYNENTDKWLKPENAGMPINSSNDDIYFIKYDEGNKAMFTSRREGGYGEADIYEVDFKESSQVICYLKFNTTKVTDKSSYSDLSLFMYDDNTGRILGSYKPNKEYMSMVLVAEVNRPVKMVIESHGCEPIIEHRRFSAEDKELSLELHDKIKTEVK